MIALWERPSVIGAPITPAKHQTNSRTRLAPLTRLDRCVCGAAGKPRHGSGCRDTTAEWCGWRPRSHAPTNPPPALREMRDQGQNTGQRAGQNTGQNTGQLRTQVKTRVKRQVITQVKTQVKTQAKTQVKTQVRKAGQKSRSESRSKHRSDSRSEIRSESRSEHRPKHVRS